MTIARRIGGEHKRFHPVGTSRVTGVSPRIACIQLRAGTSPDDNLAAAERFVREAASDGAEIALLPERWEAFGSADEIRAAAQPLDGPRLAAVQGWARELGMAIVAGSVAERVAGDDRLRNTSVAFDGDGRQVGVYRKIHQFDVDLPGQRVRESDTDAPGTGGSIAALGDLQIGLTICYDLRFPELYRAYAVAGATVLTVPAAFLERTGRDHWEVLLRARAIENQCFVVASAQFGDHNPVRRSYGRSLIADPWGTLLCVVPDGEGIGVAELDFARQADVRRRLPALRHRRL
jgi:deaminated glutathione amidase